MLTNIIVYYALPLYYGVRMSAHSSRLQLYSLTLPTLIALLTGTVPSLLYCNISERSIYLSTEHCLVHRSGRAYCTVHRTCHAAKP